MKNTRSDRKIYKIAFLVALACGLQIFESLIPHPIPGLRLGLANMVTLTALVLFGFGYALEIALLRVVLSSFIMGTFMSPTFILSFSGALASTLLMGFFYWLSGLSRHVRLSIIGISIIGAFAHNLVQLYLAYLLLIKHSGIFMFFPWLSIGAIGTGWIVGIVAGGVCRRLSAASTSMAQGPIAVSATALRLPAFAPERSWLHRVPAEIKLVALFLVALSLLVSSNLLVYLFVFLFVGAMVLFSSTPPLFCFSAARRYLSLILISFFVPLFFTSGGKVLITAGLIEIDESGLRLGTLFAARIFFLILSSALLMRTTAPSELSDGMGRLLRPLEPFGLPTRHMAETFALSWTILPRIWDTAHSEIVSAQMGGIKNIRNLLPALTNLIADLYLQAELADDLWDRRILIAKEQHKNPGEQQFK